MTIAGCGSDSETFATAPPGKPRYFGDHPGQEESDAAIGRASRCVVARGDLRVSIYLDAAYAARQRYYNPITEQAFRLTAR